MKRHSIGWMGALLCVASAACGDDATGEATHAQHEDAHEHEGEPGADGEAGDDGEDGADGRDGRVGTNGLPGVSGTDGRDGSDGSACTVSEVGGATIVSCSDGTQATLAGAPDDGGSQAHDHHTARGRLFFGDETAAGMRVLDLTTGEIIATFADIAPGASLYASESGQVLSAVQGALHRVDFIATGLTAGEQGADHETLPRMLDFALAGEELGAVTPIHVDSHHGYVTVHFDGRYDAATPANNVPAHNYVIEEHELLEPDTAITVQFETAPQHGVSVVTEQGLVIVSAPTTDRAISGSPNGFTVHELTGELVQTIHDPDDFLASCWGMHGETEVAGQLLFGCHESLDGGIMVLAWDDAQERYAARKITYLGYPNAMRRTSTLRGHPSSAYAVGQWGYTGASSQYTGLVRIDPEAAALNDADVLELGAVYCDFDFERVRGERVLALARDGKVHSIDVASWSGHKTVQLLPPSETACGARMLAGEGVFYLTIADRGEIIELDVTSLEVRRVFHVGGRPRNAALAVPGGHAH